MANIMYLTSGAVPDTWLGGGVSQHFQKMSMIFFFDFVFNNIKLFSIQLGGGLLTTPPP